MKKLILTSVALSAALFAKAEIGFTQNLGQFTDQTGKPANYVLFRSYGTGPAIFVTSTGLTYVFEHRINEELSEADVEAGKKNQFEWSSISMELIGATILSENVVVEDQLPGVSNYYYAHCPNGILGVKSYHKITIREIYLGIDWIITADEVNGVAHDFLVHENGNHQFIRMKYNGLTRPVSLNEKNQLTLVSKCGTIFEGGLKVYNGNSEFPMPSYFNVNGNQVSYLIVRGARDGELLIDPPLQWSMPQASSGLDYGSGVAATRDGSGDVLGCGYTNGADFPVANAYQGTLDAQEDAVIYRLDASGTRLWSTYFGGNDIDNAKGISTDVNGNAYITGHTASQNLPVMSSLQASYGGGVYDAFIAKYNSAGVMQWASWRGGTGTDFGTAIATNPQNNDCYVVGYTNTTLNFPLVNPIQSSNGGVYDGFVMSVSANQVMNWSTYYGGTDEDKFRAVAWDPSLVATPGILIAGNTVSGNFPTVAPFQMFNGQAWFTSDAVIMKMTSGQSVQWASYCGGDEDDIATGITADAQGNVYTTGYTNSTDFPKLYVNGAYNDTVLNATLTNDAFIVKCNANGNTLLWSSFFGGTAPDYGYGIGYDQYVGVYLCGNTSSIDLPVKQPLDMNYYQPAHGDGGNYNDAFIVWFDINDTLAWSTYYGSANSEEAYALSVGQLGDLFVTGVDSNEISMSKFNPGLPTVTECYCDGPRESTLWPVPASDVINVTVFCDYDQLINLEIYDLQGKKIKTQQVTALRNNNNLQVDISMLDGGMYFMRLHKDGGTEDLRFIKR